MVDSWIDRKTGESRVVMFEMWRDSCDAPEVVAWRNERLKTDAIDVSFRDGTWTTYPRLIAGDVAVAPT
ncbi:MAG: hypothetical protein NT069_00465 [Planctomycetota bacterium]|nr:hypothetical protein [Planctomycetota bacterium]